jgi:hypothetical protein
VPPLPPPPPSAPFSPARLVFDGTFVGPMLPPPPPPPPPPVSLQLVGEFGRATAIPAPAAVSDAVLAIPLGTRKLVSMALDLLTRSDAGLRSASFYIGFVMLVTAGPVVALFGLVWLTLGEDAFSGYAEPGAWAGWLLLAALPAIVGYVVAGIDARALATAVIGGRAEGRPLRLRESIAVVRRRFWRVLGGEIVVGTITFAASAVASTIVDAVIGPVEAVDFGLSLVVSLLVGAPFVYVTAGIVIGEVGVLDAIARSFRLVVARKQLAAVVTLFGVLSQLIVLLGLSSGLDTVFRLAAGVGLVGTFPSALGVPAAAALVFAMGTLTFLVEAIAAAPAVYAFAALTHYTRGLEIGRREPLPVRRAWDPWVTPGLAIGAAIALLALLGGVGSLPL